MNKIILLVDADNINESYTQRIYEKALEFGEIYEAHCFGDFVSRKEKWEQAYYQYKMQLHYIPGMGVGKKKGQPDPNTADIALTAFAIQKMLQCQDIDICILVANDKDYIPLAKFVREQLHKKAVMFYTQQNDRAILSYDKSVYLDDNVQENNDSVAISSDQQTPETASAIATPAVKDIYGYDVSCALSQLLVENCPYGKEVLLAELGPKLKENGIKYGKSLGKYLDKMFEKYPVLKENYDLNLGNSRDWIKRITK